MKPSTTKNLGYTSLCAKILELPLTEQKKLFAFLKDVLGEEEMTSTKFIMGQEVAFVFEGKLRKGTVDKVYTNHIIVTDHQNQAYFLNLNGEHQIILISPSGKKK